MDGNWGTGYRFLNVLIPVAEVQNTVCGIAIIQVLPSMVSGVLEMTLIFCHATTSLVQVNPLYIGLFMAQLFSYFPLKLLGKLS